MSPSLFAHVRGRRHTFPGGSQDECSKFALCSGPGGSSSGRTKAVVAGRLSVSAVSLGSVQVGHRSSAEAGLWFSLAGVATFG